MARPHWPAAWGSTDHHHHRRVQTWLASPMDQQRYHLYCRRWDPSLLCEWHRDRKINMIITDKTLSKNTTCCCCCYSGTLVHLWCVKTRTASGACMEFTTIVVMRNVLLCSPKSLCTTPGCRRRSLSSAEEGSLKVNNSWSRTDVTHWWLKLLTHSVLILM